MELTNNLKKRFCKNYGIPIQIYSEPYWSSRIELFDNLFHTKEKLVEFNNDLKHYIDEQDYFEKDNVFMQTIIDDIRDSEGYQYFNKVEERKGWDERGVELLRCVSVGRADIYKDNNKNKMFLSIDLKQANFQALKHFSEKNSKEIFHAKNNWKEYLSIFTNESSKLNSKHLRQVIFGATNPARVTRYEKMLMLQLLEKIKIEYPEFATKIVSLNTDEIVIDVNNFNPLLLQSEQTVPEMITKLIEIKSKITGFCLEMGIQCQIDVFILDKIGKDEWKKVFVLNTSTEIPYKKVSAIVYPFLLRAENGEDIQEEDKVFFYEGNLCKFIDNPFKGEIADD